MAKGYKLHIELRNGITLTLHEYEFFEDIKIINKPLSQENCVEFVFNLASHYQLPNNREVGNGESYLAGMPLPAGNSIDRAGRRLAVDIHLDPSLLESLCEGQTTAISPELKRIIWGLAIGTAIESLILIWETFDSEDWINQIAFVPL
jgi:hypothetical protein